MSSVITLKSFGRLLVCCVAITVLCGSFSVAVGQQDGLPFAQAYELVEVDGSSSDRRQQQETNRNVKGAIRDGQKAVQAILLSGGTFNSATREYFDGYVFPSMTKSEALKDTGKLRYDFDRDYLGTKYVGASRSNFIESIVLPGLQKIIDDTALSPAARVNAVVLMSRLDDSPLVRSTKSPPQPSIKAFQTLATLWRGDYPEFIKAAAFAGLGRHVNIDLVAPSSRIPGEQKNQLMKLVVLQMESILKNDPDLSDDLNRWKFGKSIELLSVSRLSGETENYVDRLTALLANENPVPKWTKFEAVRGLSRLPLDTVPSEKINSLIEAAGDFVSFSLADEAKILGSSIDELIYDNILWQNVDLEVTGTDYGDSTAAGSNNRGGPGFNDDQLGSGTKGSAAKGSATKGAAEESKPIVELPNYELNLSRRRIKLITYTVRQLLASDAVRNRSTDVHKEKLKKLDSLLGKFISEGSNTGVVDLSKGAAGSGTQGSGSGTRGQSSVALQLKDCCMQMSGIVGGVVGEMRGEQPRAVAPAGEFAVPTADADAVPHQPFN